MDNTSITKLENASRMLAEVRTAKDAKKLVDLAEAARFYARKTELGLEAQNYAAEIALRARRRGGEILKQMKENGQRQHSGEYQKSQPAIFAPTLDELGITPSDSSRWQQIADMPQEAFEQCIEQTKADDNELTTTLVLREAARAKKQEEIANIASQEPVSVNGLYDVIVIDPPWPIKKIERDARPNQSEFEYPTMTLEEISALQIPCSDDCHVWLWTTQKFLPNAIDILKLWELNYVCTFVWHKPGGFQPFGLPQYNAEFAVYAHKGSPKFVDLKDFKLCFDAPRGAHSEKPESFYDMIRRVTAGRRLDMFNRRAIEGFETWGNEAS